MSSFFDDLEAQLRAAARARTGAAGETPPTAPSRTPRRRRLRAGLRSVPVVIAVASTVAVVAVALLLGVARHHGAAPPTVPAAGGGGLGSLFGKSTPKLRREGAYIAAADKQAGRTAACRTAPVREPARAPGAPGGELISILGVLRRPATAADAVPGGLAREGMTDLYTRYLRRAQVAGGLTFYVVPARSRGFNGLPSVACLAAEDAALRRALPQIPPSLRTGTLALESKLETFYGRARAQRPQDVMCIVVTASNGGGESCGLPAAEILHGAAAENQLGVLTGIVPDGVATVTLRFPAAGHRPARSLTATVHGNVYAVPAPRGISSGAQPAVIRRAAGGRLLSTYVPPTRAQLLRLCRRDPLECLALGSSGSGWSSSAASSSSSASAVGPRPRRALKSGAASASGTVTAGG
jgi:hypothetical protein